MPAVLTDTNICDPHVPATWSKVLQDLQRFVQLEAEIRAQERPSPSPEQESLLALLHERLISGSAVLLEPAAIADLPEDESRRLFARAVVCTMRIKQCIVAEGEVLDTAGSRTLALYEADFYSTAANMQSIRTALHQRLGIDEDQLYEIEAQVQTNLADAHRKQAVVRALRDEFQLDATRPDLPERAFRLFQALFPGVPLAAEEIKLILTSTLVFFCLPFEGLDLTTPRFTSLPAGEQQAIRAFFERGRRFAQPRFANFPAFGFLEPGEIDAALVGRLAERSGLSPGDVAREMARMLTILPIDKLELYLVHDVWGHGWQASMLNFERMYEELADYADPLRLDETAESEVGQRIRFRDCFRGRGAELQLDEETFHQFVHGELAERLTVAMSAVLAELIADVAEFKVLAEHPQHPEILPSTSRFKLFPSKLDLTLQDLPFYFQQATKGFRLWAKSNQRQEGTCQELVQAGATVEAAKMAVDCAVVLWDQLANDEYLPQLAWQVAGDRSYSRLAPRDEPGAHHAERDSYFDRSESSFARRKNVLSRSERRQSDQLRVNVFTRVALNFLGIHRAMLEAYRRLEELPRGSLPLKSYRDLLVIGAAVFFEADRGRNLWRIDEYLALRFVPLCRRLGWGDTMSAAVVIERPPQALL